MSFEGRKDTFYFACKTALPAEIHRISHQRHRTLRISPPPQKIKRFLWFLVTYPLLERPILGIFARCHELSFVAVYPHSESRHSWNFCALSRVGASNCVPSFRKLHSWNFCTLSLVVVYPPSQCDPFLEFLFVVTRCHF